MEGFGRRFSRYGVEEPGTVVVWVCVGLVAVRVVGGVGVVIVGVVAVTVGTMTAAGVVVVMVRVVAGPSAPEPPASFTSAAASTPRESTTTTIAIVRGAFQLGDAASRVRAAAPQLKHHS
jgi:hypothetical protein